MTNFVEFPALGLGFEVSRVAFHLFGIPIYWYGVCIGVGMLLALLLAFKLAFSYGVDVDRMIDIIFIGFVCAIICGRLYYVLFVDFQYRTFYELINLRNGGIAIYGGIIGAFAGAAIGCKWRKTPLRPMFDLVGMGFLIGQAVGRWGNFFNQEAFGDNTRSVFGMQSPATAAYLQNNQAALVEKNIFADPAMPVHPTFLYESAWCLLGFILLLWYQKRRRFHGEVFLLYVLWYGAGRAVIESLRTDPLMVGSLRVSQVLGAVSALAAAVLLVYGWRKSKGNPLVIPEIPPHTARVTVEGEDGPAVVVISWPAGEAPPSREQKQALALEVLESEKQKAAEDAAAEKADAGPDEKQDEEDASDAPDGPKDEDDA